MPRTDPDACRQHVSTTARMYVRQAGAMSYADLRDGQSPPWASVKFGAAGIAYALSRPDVRRLRLQDVESAERLVEAAARGRERGTLLSDEPIWSTIDFHDSLYFGRIGLDLTRVLVAARAARDGNARLLRSLLQRCHRARGGQSELLLGVAGLLTGLIILYRARRAPAVLRVAGALAEDLLQRARGERGWARMPQLAFAHGRAGVFHALLGWSMAAKRELPAWFFDEVSHLASDIARDGRMGAPRGDDDLERSWCNGAAGLVLLWARAYECTGEPKYRVRARAAARFLLTRTAGCPGNLCCGLGGRSFALLAMDRVEPGRGWDARALHMAWRAVDAMTQNSGPWPNGLYNGFPGIVCLAGDLLVAPDKRAGFPLVEG